MEKDLLLCAASLAGRTLMRSSSRFSTEDFRRVEVELDKERFKTEKMKVAVATSEAAWQRGCKTRAEVGQALESGIVALLTRGMRDPCSLETFFWFPSWSSTLNGGVSKQVRTSSGSDGAGNISAMMFQVLSQHGLSGEAEVVTKMLLSGESKRKVGIVWIPLKTPDGNIVALIRVERKIASHFDPSSFEDDGRRVMEDDGGGPQDQFSFSGPLMQPTLSDLVISKEEEEMLNIFARLSFPMLDRLSFVADAFQGVQQASQAIAALQAVQTGLENRLSVEVAHRLQYEEAIKAGIEMLGLTNAKR